MLTKSLTSFTGFVVGDAIAQASTGDKYNYWRTARFAAYGFCIHAPVCHVWYGLLDRSVMVKAPTRCEVVGPGLPPVWTDMSQGCSGWLMAAAQVGAWQQMAMALLTLLDQSVRKQAIPSGVLLLFDLSSVPLCLLWGGHRTGCPACSRLGVSDARSCAAAAQLPHLVATTTRLL